ncbi:hypothetical protein HPHPA11_1078 [Helicobacter pylori Hp A-11]|uniref:Uncharacterized protein n=1 Tax=Helicobacter pylori Hp A-11 TaxID=992035 RepID=N4TL47_HELPX|nr:hypothetical protein HPHPA11_1078 [Helicobacter pylori Hp A-11]
MRLKFWFKKASHKGFKKTLYLFKIPPIKNIKKFLFFSQSFLSTFALIGIFDKKVINII